MIRRARLILALLLALIASGTGFMATPATAHVGDYWTQRSVAWNHACGAYNRCTFNWSWTNGEHSRGFCFSHSSGYYGYSDRVVLISHNNVIFGSYWAQPYC